MLLNKSELKYLGILYSFQKKLLLLKSISIFRYIRNIRSILIALANTLFKQEAAVIRDQIWTKNELLSIITSYTSKDGKNEKLLNEFLFYLKSESNFIPMEEAGLDNFETTYNLKIILCQLTIFKTLIKLDPTKYLYAKENFLEKIQEAGIEIPEEININREYILSESYDGFHQQDTSTKKSEIDIKAIYDELYNSEIDKDFPEKFIFHLNDFDQDMLTSLYNKMESVYFQIYDPEILKAISAYYNIQQESEGLSGKIRIFLRGMESAENPFEKQKKFAYSIDPLIKKAFACESNYNSIQEARSYLYSFGMKADMLPSAMDCGDKLFHEDENIQLEYAKYLALMKIDAVDAYSQILNRLNSAFGNSFYNWTDSNSFGLDSDRVEGSNGRASLKSTLIDILGYVHKEKREAFISIIYALSSTDYDVKEHARDALINIGCICLPELKQTFNYLLEDFGRDKMLEVFQTFSSCSNEVIPFLESLNINDGYLKGRIQETISLIKNN